GPASSVSCFSGGVTPRETPSTKTSPNGETARRTVPVPPAAVDAARREASVAPDAPSTLAVRAFLASAASGAVRPTTDSPGGIVDASAGPFAGESAASATLESPSPSAAATPEASRPGSTAAGVAAAVDDVSPTAAGGAAVEASPGPTAALAFAPPAPGVRAPVAPSP